MIVAEDATGVEALRSEVRRLHEVRVIAEGFQHRFVDEMGEGFPIDFVGHGQYGPPGSHQGDGYGLIRKLPNRHFEL
jgi:hypothetical protein